ncbi:MAG: hypothetical protein AAGI27_02670 [Pseudomonadota bacterium]
MSEFEKATLFFQIIETAHSAMANYLTVVFAVVAVSYFVADRLDRLAAFLLIVVYSFFCFGMIREIFFLYSDMARLGHEMAQVSGDVYRWLGIALSSKDAPAWVIPYSSAVMSMAAYLASLLFFYRVRRGDKVATETS